MALRGYVRNEDHTEIVNTISYLFSEIIEDIQCTMLAFLCFGPCYLTCGGGQRRYSDRINTLQSEIIPKLNDQYGFTSRGIQYRLVTSFEHLDWAQVVVELAADSTPL